MRQHHINVQYREFSVSTDRDHIENHFEQMKNQKHQFDICIMDGNKPEDIDQLKINIKTSGTLNKGKLKFMINQTFNVTLFLFSGVMTQCVYWPTVKNNRSVQSYCEHLVRKINMKNSGINTQVQLDVLRRNRTKSPDALMFFGADVIHPTNVTRSHPSIAGLTFIFESFLFV